MAVRRSSRALGALSALGALAVRGALVIVVVAVTVWSVVTPAESYPGAPWFEPSKPYDANFPDPSVIRVGSTYYAYSTPTGGAYLPAMSSTDLVTWIARPAYDPGPPENEDPFFNDALPRPAPWGIYVDGDQELWAPGVARIGSHYVAFYALRVWGEPARFCIAVATASDPLGPFENVGGGPLQCDDDPAGSIDPQPFVDTDGTPYLLWKSEGVPGSLPTRLWIRRLAPAGTSFAAGSAPVELLRTSQPWEGNVIESPSLVRYQGRLFLFYSANEWDSPHYATGYAECASVTGPCHKPQDGPVLASRGDRLGPGGPSAFIAADGTLRLAYHWWNAPYSSYPAHPECESAGTCTTQGQRRLAIDRVHLDGHGLTVGGIPTPVRSIDPSCPSGSVPPAGFADVGGSNVHARAIDCVVWWRVASGRTPSTYQPAASVTRAQMATFIVNLIDALDGPLPPPEPDRFGDDDGSTHEASINRLAAAGIVGGFGDGTYRPDQPVSRAQMASFLVRTSSHLGMDVTGGVDYFWDDAGSVHQPAIDAAAGAGLTGGRRVGVYAPDDPVQRDQMASFLARMLSMFVTEQGATPPG